MATESPVRMLAGTGLNGSIGGLSENFRGSSSSSSSREAQELSLLLRERSRLENIHYNHDMLLHRSESAPPSVEGSQAAIDFLANQPTGLGALNRFSKMGVGDEAEQELRSDPAYLAYYYSHINLNPRLPPPLISWENWHLAQKLQSGLSMAESKDRMKLRSFDDNSSKSLFSLQPLLPTHKEEPEHFEDKRSLENFAKQTSREWAEARADAMMAAGLGNRPKSLVDLIQEDFPRTPSPVYNLSRSSSRAANDEGIDAAAMEMQLSHFRELASGMSSNQVGTQVLGELRDPKGSSIGAEDISVTGGLGSRSVTPKPGLMFGGSSSSVRSGSPAPQSGASGLSSTFNSGVSETRSGPGTNMSKASTVAELAASLHGININDVQGSSMIDQRGQSQQGQGDHDEQHSLQLQQHRQQRSQTPVHSQFSQSLGHQQAFQKAGTDQGYRGQSKFLTPSLQTSGNASATSNVYAAAAAAAAMSYIAAGNPYYQNLHSSALYAPNYGLGGYPMSAAMMPSMLGGYPAPGGLPVPFDSAAAAAAAAAAVAANMGSQSVSGTSGAAPDLQQYYKLAGQGGTGVPSAVQDALYLQYMQRAAEDARTAAVLADPSVLQGYMGGSRADSFDMHKGHLAAAMSYTADQRSQFARSGAVGVPIANRAVAGSPGYYGSPPGLGMMMPYPNSPVGSPILPGSPVSNSGFSLRRDDRGSRLLCMPGRTGSLAWQTQRGSETSNELRGSVLLEEFKTSKSRRFELSDISGHVVEFSADQHGSRFIQQKLETATAEEKSMVFQEVLPQAYTLMTDVFGNYVIQKFFEHGNSQQRRELATQLVGRMLVLSLQMYGCRVIQKALEVVDVDQQTQLVSELDGHVMRCVRDQNGNHVIQKCIECVPPDRIQFIISAFYSQVVSLSTHPYGCRVIQRVLEHCTDEQKQSGIMEEILQATCSLAQDQYGNYVIQHVLEHGKPYERSEILTKLAGQIVQMSQHKFASNVVEKCLEFGGHTERQILINEMLGHTEENMPLQAMMKDQFANYVVQKVLETCDDQQREILLGRIKVHLHALKKYTYGKHIVARVEKLVAAGERRSAAHVTN